MSPLPTPPSNNLEPASSWPDEYRPETIEDLALSVDNRRLLERYGEDGQFPSLLLHGPPGVGKTTLAAILTASTEVQVLRLDGVGDRSLDVIRDTVGGFVKALAFRPRKAVVIDEAEGLLHDAQLALRRLMEMQQDRCSFILITNRPEKLDGPIRSRCTSIAMSEVPVSERERVLSRVLEGEGLAADEFTIWRFAAAHQDLRAMLTAAQRSYTQYGELRPPPQSRGGARFLRDIVLDPEYSAEIEWDLEPYTAKGCLTLFAGPAKLAGKSTFLRHYAAAKELGLPFLGQKLTAGRVLWVGPDEPFYHTARCFAEELGLPEWVMLWDVFRGKTPSIEQIVAEVERSGIDLVILDTLPKIARVTAENDNGVWNAWADVALPLIHRSGAAFVAIHHFRKSGGTGAEAIRGASAIFAFVDIGLSLTAGGDDRQRILTVEGSRLGLPESRMIELTDDGYVDLGDADAEQNGDAGLSNREDILGVLADWLPLREIRQLLAEKGVELKDNALRRRLEQLVSEGLLTRDGSGKSGDPYRWSRPD